MKFSGYKEKDNFWNKQTFVHFFFNFFLIYKFCHEKDSFYLYPMIALVLQKVCDDLCKPVNNTDISGKKGTGSIDEYWRSPRIDTQGPHY